MHVATLHTVGPGDIIGEHGQRKLLVLWTERTSKEAADLSDFTLATQKAA
jgi:hypothetical protein